VRIRSLLLLLFAILFALITARTLLHARLFREAMAEYDVRLAHDGEVDKAIEVITTLAIDLETGVRGFQITRDRTYLNPYTRAEQRRVAALDHFIALERLNLEDALVAERVRERLNAWCRTVAAPLLAVNSPPDGATAAALTEDGMRRMDEIRADLEILRHGGQRRRTLEKIAFDHYQRDLTRQMFWLTVLTAVVLMVLGSVTVVLIAWPLARLGEHARRVGQGDFHSIEVRGVAEVTVLGRAANQMVERLAAERSRQRSLTEELTAGQAALEARNKEIGQASRFKSDFLASMSHELRTPLNAVIGFSDLLLAGDYGPLDPRHEPVIHEVLAAGNQLLTLINDVLDLSKIEAGRVEVSVVSIDVAVPVIQACALLAGMATKKSVRVVNSVAPGALVAVADPDRVRQVLVNLVSNAVKFTPEGGSVTIEAVAEDGRVRVSVIDTGIGIAAADVPRLFVPFSQLESSYAHRLQGTGLGLSICKRLLALMDGEIGLTTDLGKGTTFSFLLPAAPSRSELPRLAIVRPQTIASTPPPSRSPRRRVLVVDDNEVNRKVLRVMLDHFPCDVIEAGDAQASLLAVRAQRPDVILMDVQLPGMDGLAATALLRADPETHSIPVIAVTAHAMPGDEDRALAAGCIAYISKPIARAALFEALSVATGADWCGAEA
jgi:signal transduction histidine kinase/ActR/RegA family two-component response regulator